MCWSSWLHGCSCVLCFAAVVLDCLMLHKSSLIKVVLPSLFGGYLVLSSSFEMWFLRIIIMIQHSLDTNTYINVMPFLVMVERKDVLVSVALRKRTMLMGVKTPTQTHMFRWFHCLHLCNIFLKLPNKRRIPVLNTLNLVNITQLLSVSIQYILHKYIPVYAY